MKKFKMMLAVLVIAVSLASIGPGAVQSVADEGPDTYDAIATRHGYYRVLTATTGEPETVDAVASRHGYYRVLTATANESFDTIARRHGYYRVLVMAKDLNSVALRHGYYRALLAAASGDPQLEGLVVQEKDQ